MEKSEKRWIVGGGLFLLLVILVCMTSPYWGQWGDVLTNRTNQCNCPWCQAERAGANLDDYGLEYNYSNDGLQIVITPYGMLDSNNEDSNDAVVNDTGDTVSLPEESMNQGYYVFDDNGHDVVLYTGGDGIYYYCDSEDGVAKVTDNEYDIDESFGCYGGKMPVVDENGQTIYLEWSD